VIRQAKFNKILLHPQYWLYWCLLPFMKALSCIPLSIQMKLGRFLGRCIPYIDRSRAQVAHKNISSCFPKLDQKQVHALWQKNLEETGCAIFDTLNAWFWSDEKVAAHSEAYGLDHLKHIPKEQGILYFTIHSLPLEMGARIIGLTYSGYGVYRPHNHPFIDYVQLKGRLRGSFGMIPKRDTRSMIRKLREGAALWYTADQDSGRAESIFAPFLGVKEARTITATSNLARVGRAKLVPFFVERKPDHTYSLTLNSMIEHFPSSCITSDTHYVNELTGELVQRNIAQYLWMHKRFKTRPEHDPQDFYT